MCALAVNRFTAVKLLPRTLFVVSGGALDTMQPFSMKLFLARLIKIGLTRISRDSGSETRIPARGQMVMPIMSGVEHHDLDVA